MSSAAESVLKKHHTLHITYINFGCLCFCSWLRNVSYMWNSVTLIQSNRIVLDGRHKKGIQGYTKPDSRGGTGEAIHNEEDGLECCQK